MPPPCMSRVADNNLLERNPLVFTATNTSGQLHPIVEDLPFRANGYPPFVGRTVENWGQT